MSFPYQGGRLMCKVLIGWSICVEAEGAGKVGGKKCEKKKINGKPWMLPGKV